MSEDRNNGIGDPAVSDTYRDVATERAPASLNEAVLRNAAAHANKGYAHSMLWIRPLAYAATVVLSLAIVVQIVLPPMNADMSEADFSPAAAAQERVDASNLPLADGAREQAADDDDPLKRLRDQEVREETKIEEFAVPGVSTDDVPAMAASAAPGVSPEPVAESVVDFADTDQAFDANGLAESEEVAVTASRLRQPETLEGAALASETALQEASSLAVARAVQPGDYDAAVGFSAFAERSICEPDDIESPESWMDCIERLEETGQADEVLAERRLLLEAFPDFEWPSE